MDANEMYDTIMLQLNNQIISDSDETKEEQESFMFQEETDLAHFPPSLLRYFETSKSRAAVCEKLILEEFEDVTASHHTEDMMNLPCELDKDMMKLNEQDEELSTSSDTRLLPAPTEALFTHNVSVCPNNEDEAGTGECMESEKRLALEYKTEREKLHCEEVKKEEQKRQIERDFQKELEKLMEAEKLRHYELEQMGKTVQEKLDQELQLQQELMSSFQRRVEEERRMMDEEQKRKKDEEDKRKKEEEKFRIDAERKRMEEERRVKKEEEMKLKHEEEEKRRKEREEKRMREEERNKIYLEKKKLEDEMRMKEEEERKRGEEIERIKKEKRKQEEEREEAKKRMEKEKRDMEEKMSLKRKEEERKKREEENMRIEEERRKTKEIEERKKQDEMRKKRREEEALEKMHEEMRRKEEETNRKRREEEEKEEARKRERERQKMEEEKEVVSKMESENRTMKGPRPIEWKTGEEERKRRQQEDMRQEDEEGYRESEEDITLKEDKEGYEGYDVDNMKMEHESETGDKEKKQEEEEKKTAKEEMRKGEERMKEEKELKEEEVGENKKENGLKQKEEGKKRDGQSREEEAGVVDELQEQRESDSTNKDQTKKTPASQLEHSTTSSPLHSESTVSPTCTETKAQQHHPEENITHTSAHYTVDCENQAARPSTVPVSLPVCLPEHTEKKRLSWMKDCVPWSKLSLQNRRKHKGSVCSRRGPRVPSSLPPLCPDSLLKPMGWKSLQEVTTVTLQDLPGCSLNTLAQCTQLRCLTLRCCGLRSLDGINQLPQLCYIDVQDNDISFVNCENMTSLRVLKLGHNKLSSIDGLTGAENLDVLDLSYNSISRIAGLESVRRLQRLSVDHNQLISTKGLRDVYTLRYLNCSHNHLVTVEGLENSALLHTLDLRGNSLTEPPCLNNQVLLRELYLDDNSISSLQGLAACWLPLMQQLSVAQNRITQLPSMSDSVSLANLDLRFNCMSELQDVCDSLEGCHFLREVHLTGNPLQQETGWRSTLQRAVPGLRAIDDQETDSFRTPPAVQQVSLASGSFLMFCQAQLLQTQDLQQQHSRELSKASSSLDAVKISCRHFTEALQLASDQRFAHEYGDTTVAAGQTTPEEALDMDSTKAERHTESPEMESAEKGPLIASNRDRRSNWTFEEKPAADSRHDTLDGATTGPKTGPTVSRANSGSVHFSATKGKRTSSRIELAAVSNHEDLQNTAAVVIQQLWRKYRQKSDNISSPSTTEEGGGRGDGAEPESGPSDSNRSLVGQHNAATVIQALWRGFALRRRLASALAAVTCPDTGEDDTFEEVDVDEFVFDEAALEKHWTLSLCEDSPPRRYPVSHQPQSQKLPVHFPEPSEYILPPPLMWRPKQAWVPGEQVDSAGQTESCNRSKSPSSTSVLSGLSERSEKILEEWGFTDSRTALQMLKRAQKMKPTTKQQKKRKDPSIRLALFGNCSYQLGSGEARHRPAQHNRSHVKVAEAEPRLCQAEKVERVKQERAQQWLHTQAAAHSDRDPESVHFLPEISPDILNGGRVQLVADPGYTERLHHASGSWANNSLAAQPCRESSYPRRNSLGHARKEVPPPQRVTSTPSKKERISHRDNPVQLSVGWGGGKKRDRVYK